MDLVSDSRRSFLRSSLSLCFSFYLSLQVIENVGQLAKDCLVEEWAFGEGRGAYFRMGRENFGDCAFFFFFFFFLIVI